MIQKQTWLQKKWRFESVLFKWFCHIDGPMISAESTHLMIQFTVLSKKRNWCAQSIWKINFISNQPVMLHAYVGVDLNAFVFVHVGGTFVGFAGMQAELFQL